MPFDLQIQLKPKLGKIIGNKVRYGSGKNQRVIGKVIEYDRKTGLSRIQIYDEQYHTILHGKINGSSPLTIEEEED